MVRGLEEGEMLWWRSDSKEDEVKCRASTGCFWHSLRGSRGVLGSQEFEEAGCGPLGI